MSVNVKRALWAAALIFLAAALIYFNSVPSGESLNGVSAGPADDSRSGGAPLGCGVGERLPDFTAALTDGGVFALADARGKVTMINLWATWCAPCVKELPYFDRLLKAHPDDLRVLAVHSDFITDDVDAYLADFDYAIDFTVDEDGSLFALVEGSTMLPQTVVLNRRGEVIYNRVGSVTWEALEELYAAAAE